MAALERNQEARKKKKKKEVAATYSSPAARLVASPVFIHFINMLKLYTNKCPTHSDSLSLSLSFSFYLFFSLSFSLSLSLGPSISLFSPL